MRTLALTALALALVVSGCATHAGPTGLARPTGSSAPQALPPPPTRIGHVFVVVLENEDYETTFARDPGPSLYLAQVLPAQGVLLTQYYGIGHASLGNYIAMVSGQAPNSATQQDCPVFADFAGTSGGPGGQAVGQGCVYPKDILTVGDQLTAAHRTWRAYGQDMANGTAAQSTSCRHPQVGQREDSGGSQSARDQYATRHEPFVYFHSVIDDRDACSQRVVDLAALPGDLASADTTPSLVFISPDVCSDGHDAQCANPDQPGGYAGIEQFLRVWVPRILASPAYEKDGLLVVTFDEADSTSADACCGETPGPGAPAPGITGPGGGRTGTVLLSRCLAPGTQDTTPYNHYSLLRTVEDIFGLAHLGYAGQAGLVPVALGACPAQ